MANQLHQAIDSPSRIWRPGPLVVKLACALTVACGLFVSSAMSRPPQEPGQGVQPPTTAVPLDGCVTSECHSGIKDRSFLHGPLYVNACDACHTLTDAEQHTYVDARPREATCLHCHELDFPELGSSHEPALTGECLACHDPHGGSERSLLRAVKGAESCAKCHDNSEGDAHVAHNPELAGACGACHDPHSSPNQKLLSAPGRDLCLGCHVVVGLQLDLLHTTHPPARSDCLICHDPHATDTPGMLIKSPESLCTGCHVEVRHMIDGAISQHAAVTNERSCLNCHDPHASDHVRLLREETMTLCFECHDRTQDREGGGIVADIELQIAKGASVHGPVEEGNCVACHQIHGGDFERLLRREYSIGAYTTFDEGSYSLCFGCHDRSLAAFEKAAVVTQFRNGDRNLHFVHVAKNEKGRTCHVCHDPHAGLNEHHLRGSVPYGPSGWKLPIAWSATENGGSCSAACHETLEYNRVEPVEYPEPPTDLKRTWPRLIDDENKQPNDDQKGAE